VKGRDNVPRRGPLLVVSNHINVTDPPIVGTSLPRVEMFMAKEELFRSKLTGAFLRGLGGFPVNRQKFDRAAMRQAQKTLEQGMVLIMFPEGARSKDACLQPARPGSAMVAFHSNVPILPVGIYGTEKIRVWAV